jgi:hypothetical protein
VTGANTLVSHSAPLATVAPTASSTNPVISHDGNFVAFVSFATNLVPGQNGPTDTTNVFLYSRQTGAITLVSGANGSASATANSYSDSPDLNDDGSFVVFRSNAANLVPGQSGPPGSNIFLFSRQPGTSSLALVSHAAGGPTTTMAAGNSTSPVIDGDGGLVAYLSTANNLVPGQSAGGINNVFGWVRQADSNFLVSGQDGSPTVISPFPTFLPIVSRDPIILFNVSGGTLIGNTQGTINAIANKLIDLSLTAIRVVAGADGNLPAGTQVGTLQTQCGFLSQVVFPTYTLPALAVYPDNDLFSPGPVDVSTGWSPLMTRVAVNLSNKSSFSILVQDVLGQFSDKEPFTFSASQVQTAVGLTSSSLNPVCGQPVTFTATVTSNGSQVVSSGTVTFEDGNTGLGTPVPVGPSGQAMLTVTLKVGQHPITAYYNGTALYAASSGTLTETVGKAGTNTVVSPSANPSVFGQSVIFTATVGVMNPGAGIPTGLVQFGIDGSNIGLPVTVSTTAGASTATFTTGFFIGTHTISASYLGDANFSNSSSTALTQTVGKASTSTAVSSSANPSVSGQSVTFTATVNVQGPGSTNVLSPTGMVIFFDGSSNIGQGTLSTTSGVTSANFSTSTLTVATHTVTASYSGDGNFLTSTSVNLTQVVNPPPFARTTTLSSSANPSVSSQRVTFIATVTGTASGTPTGSVTFLEGITALGQGTLSGNGGTATASFATSSLAAGSHTITASYDGDGSFAGRTSAASMQTVGNATTVATTTTVTSSADPQTQGQPVSWTAAVATPGAVNFVNFETGDFSQAAAWPAAASMAPALWPS